MTSAPGGLLAVVVDGVAMAEDEARAVWQRFSAYMEEHHGNLAGFARKEGFVSAHPRSAGGKAVLVLSRTEAQEVYGASPTAKLEKGAGGSSVRQTASAAGSIPRGKSRGKQRNRRT